MKLLEDKTLNYGIFGFLPRVGKLTAIRTESLPKVQLQANVTGKLT